MTALVQITRELSVNPDHIAWIGLDTRHYANTAGPTILTIVMADGERHRVEHTPHHLDGNDVYRIKERLEAALSHPQTPGRGER